ncbi:MAG: DUF2254 domain-containing protein [Minwuia sp.]|nr:DUF2254 domain-containing protein [Minwuia sp.]
MISKWQWLILQLSRTLWIRVALFCLLAVITVLVAPLLDPLVPASLSERVSGDAVESTLDILASSMLAVTTFSLSVMVSAYAAAATSVTPRATALLMQDTTTQNVLATFIGTFVFSLVGIIALNTGFYGGTGQVTLLGMTIAVTLMMIMTLFRWIEHLSRLGRVSDTTDRVERAAFAAICGRVDDPALGGRILGEDDDAVPEDVRPLHITTIGYLQHLALDQLSDAAEKAGGDIFVHVLPGQFIHPAMKAASLSGFPEEFDTSTLQAAFRIGRDRSFDQDPRFGLVVLSEIASRALSPAVNDTGTAKDVMARAVRLLLLWSQRELEHDQRRDGPEVRYPRIWVPPLALSDLFDDLFTPIARDGATHVDVHIALQNGLSALHATRHDGMRREALRHSKMAVERSDAALLLDSEKQRVRKAAQFPERSGDA